MGIFDLFKPNVEKLEKKKDVHGLIKALRYKKDEWDEDDVRRSAADALGKIKDERAVEPLIKVRDYDGTGADASTAIAIFHKTEYIRKAAKEALEKINAKKS